ncbi:hypothetical protein ANCCAN_08543 [Ancylostoma caninum]|uniref:DUF3719 domain-containing protein n=1 Tax=Ancylostoma caninum TaxID=29170 RepID=A0A368GM55_ANCCA|nr:hypothetical protein ANCCAN_08543 [Ancylostoma caninum]
MSRWSESIYSEPNTARSSHRGFLSELDACLYEGVPMEDPQLDAEAREWAARFVHLRVLGVKCGVPSPKLQDSTISSSTRNAPLASPQENGQVVARPAMSRPSRISPMKKSSKSSAQSRPAGDHLPKLSNLKTK